MEKYIKMQINKQVDSGTTDGVPLSPSDLVDAGQNFLTTVSVGDFVHNTTDNAWHVVADIIDNDTLTLVDGEVPTGKGYIIYSGAEKIDQLVPAKNGPFVKAASGSSATITYTSSGSTGADIITVAHNLDADYDGTLNPTTAMKTALENTFIEAAKTPWTSPLYTFTNPAGACITAITVG